MSDKNSCIFLIATQGFAARYLLHTGIFKTLKASGRKIVILTPNPDEEYFRNQYGTGNVVIEKLELEKCQSYIDRKSILRFMRQLRFYVLNGKCDLQSVNDHYKVFLAENDRDGRGLFMRKIFDVLIKIMRASLFARRTFLRLESFLYSPDFHRGLFMKHRPSLVVTTSLGNVGENIDYFILREAKKHGVKTVTVFLSWDNPTSKGMGGAMPDSIIAWTDVMKEEIVNYHDYPADRIFVGGVAHFDVYHQREKFCSRESFLSRFGMAADRRVLLFGTKSPVSYPWNPEILEIIASAINDGRFAVPCQLLVRVHPLHYSERKGKKKNTDTLEEYARLQKKYRYVHLNEPQINSTALKHDMPEEEMEDLAGILHHTDILINMFSTLTIEAALMNIPIVNVSFEGSAEKKKHPRQDIAMDIAQVHNQRVIKSGAVRMAYNEKELIDAVNAYLLDPALDGAQRELVAKRECGPYPGNAGRTIGSHILSLS